MVLQVFKNLKVVIVTVPFVIKVNWLSQENLVSEVLTFGKEAVFKY